MAHIGSSRMAFCPPRRAEKAGWPRRTSTRTSSSNLNSAFHRAETVESFCARLRRALSLGTAWKSKCSTTTRPSTRRSSRGSTAAVYTAWWQLSLALKKAGEWQKYVIICDGQLIKVILNGMVVVDANLADFQGGKPAGSLDGKPHPGVECTQGYIGLQSHSTAADYRNIRIRTLQ